MNRLMKPVLSSLAPLLVVGAIGCGGTSDVASDDQSSAGQATPRAQAPTMKYTTEIPANVQTPDRTETRLGTLEFTDGFPTEATAEKVWDHMDFSRAVEVMKITTPPA